MVPVCFRWYYENVCVHKPAFYLLCSTDNGAVDRSLASIDTSAARVSLPCTYALRKCASRGGWQVFLWTFSCEHMFIRLSTVSSKIRHLYSFIYSLFFSGKYWGDECWCALPVHLLLSLLLIFHFKTENFEIMQPTLEQIKNNLFKKKKHTKKHNKTQKPNQPTTHFVL